SLGLSHIWTKRSVADSASWLMILPPLFMLDSVFGDCVMPDLVEQVSRKLIDLSLMLVTAESCTGGLIAAAITNRPGSSAVFERGFVTYSNESKTELLSVSADVLREHGAVSARTAIAMARGALNNSRADVS